MENEKKVAKDYWFIEDRLYSCDCVSDEPIKTDPCFKVIHCKEVLPSQDKEGWIHPDRFYAMVALNDEKNRQIEQLLELKKWAIEVINSIASIGKPRHGDYDYWNELDKSTVIEVVVTDTNLCRSFIEKWDK